MCVCVYIYICIYVYIYISKIMAWLYDTFFINRGVKVKILINNKPVASLCRTGVPEETSQGWSLLLLPGTESTTLLALVTCPPPGPQSWDSLHDSAPPVKIEHKQKHENYSMSPHWVHPFSEVLNTALNKFLIEMHGLHLPQLTATHHSCCTGLV